MKNSILFIIAFTFLWLQSHSQCEEFMIYQTKGEVKLLHGTSSQPAQKNMKLSGSDRLTLAPEAAVILLSGKDKALRLTTSGTFSQAQIKSICMQNQSSLTKEYLNYVARSIIEKGEPMTAQVIKGAVYRTRTEFEKTLMILPADSSVVSADPLIFQWHMDSYDSPVYLLIYENGVKQIYSKMISDSTISLEANLFQPDVMYFWLISSSPAPSDKEVRFTFIQGAPDWQNKMLEEWAATMKELQGQMDSLRMKMKKKKMP